LWCRVPSNSSASLDEQGDLMGIRRVMDVASKQIIVRVEKGLERVQLAQAASAARCGSEER